ncbi:MAG: acyltransferase [Dermatophilaceae bacterium]
MSAIAGVREWATRRQLYVDNLKAILVAGIIAGHAAIGYAGSTDAWSYSDVREATLSPVTESIVLALLLFAGFVIPLLFLIAGLYTPGSLQRKGIGGYVRDRLLRLGVPFLLFAVLLWPLLEYGLFRWLGTAPEFVQYWRAEGTLDTGVLWFVGALLLFSLAYAGWMRLGPLAAWTGPFELRARHLVLLTAAVTVLTFLVRLVVPLEADNPIIDLNLWEWPACAALFGLGVVCSRDGWLQAVPGKLRRQGGAVGILAVAALVVFVATTQTLGIQQEQLAGGWAWPPLVFVLLERALSRSSPPPGCSAQPSGT